MAFCGCKPVVDAVSHEKLMPSIQPANTRAQAGEPKERIGVWRGHANPATDFDDGADQRVEFQTAAGFGVLQHRGFHRHNGRFLSNACHARVDMSLSMEFNTRFGHVPHRSAHETTAKSCNCRATLVDRIAGDCHGCRDVMPRCPGTCCRGGERCACAGDEVGRNN